MMKELASVFVDSRRHAAAAAKLVPGSTLMELKDSLWTVHLSKGTLENGDCSSAEQWSERCINVFLIEDLVHSIEI